jgi:hypothetical protein
MLPNSLKCWRVGVICLLWLAAPPAQLTQTTHFLRNVSATEPREVADPLLQPLRNRVAQQPDDAVGWRLLGAVYERHGELVLARDAYFHAVQHDPENAAARCGLGRVLVTLGDFDGAVSQLQQAVWLAPDSHYAEESRSLIDTLPDAARGPTEAEDDVEEDRSMFIQPVNFVTDWLKGPALTESPVSEYRASAFDLSVDLGLQFNSNVELAPISRQLSPFEDGSFQTFLAPDMEYAVIDNSYWRLATNFYGFFNFNEGHLDTYNLEHYEPGVSLERYVLWHDMQLVPRLAYNYSYDAFQGERFGVRHAIAGSLTTLLEDGQSWLTYLQIDQTNFDDDGLDPTISSLDGWSYTLGGSYATEVDSPHLELIRTGVDLQLADLDGSSYSYQGVMLYVSAELPMFWHCLAVIDLGWGFRDFPDFEFSPSRNENIWHAGIDLERPISEHWSITGTFEYDRFASRNELFDADRFVAGAYLTYRRP